MSKHSINHVIIHELVKEQHKEAQEPNLRDEVLDSSHKVVVRLLSDIINLYGKRFNTAHYGTFLRSPDNKSFTKAFALDFETYSEKEIGEEEIFVEFSKETVRKLSKEANLATASTGGYIFLADYSTNDYRFIIVAMIKSREGISLSKNLVPEELMELDLNNLNQAARISFSKFNKYKQSTTEEQAHQNYLSFISQSKARATSSYFVTALGCAKGAAAPRATDLLIRETTNFFRKDGRLKHLKKEFKKQLLTTLVEKAENKKSIKLYEVEKVIRSVLTTEDHEEIEDICSEIIKHLNSEDIAIPTEFPVHKDSVRKHTHIKTKTESWEILFDRASLGSEVSAEIQYDKDNNRVILNNIPDDIGKTLDNEINSRK